MWPPWACVAASQWPKEKCNKALDAATLAQGDIEVEAGRRAAAGRCCGLAKCSPAGTRTTHFDRPHYRTALGRQGKSPSNAKTMTAAAWSVKPNWWCFRDDEAKGYGRSFPYGVRLLVLAAEVSGIGVCGRETARPTYGTTILFISVAFQRWCCPCGWAT